MHLLASLEDAIASLEAAQSRAAGKTGGGPGADAPVRSPQARPSTADRITALVGGKERGDSPAPRDRAGQGGPAGEPRCVTGLRKPGGGGLALCRATPCTLTPPPALTLYSL